MKRKILITSVVLIGVVLIVIGISFGIKSYKIKHAKVNIVLKDNLELDVYDDTKRVSYFINSINGKIVDDYIIDSKKVGKKKVKFTYINDDGIKVNSSFAIDVVDRVAPIIWVSGSYSVALNSKRELKDMILCGDNYDKRPSCDILGDYDISKVGKYPLKYKAVDKSGNISEENFILNVYDPADIKERKPKKIYFNDVATSYKNKDTKVGIDISKWQGDVDFNKLKEAGVDFVIVRVGTKNKDNQYVLDEKFKRNISNLNKLNIPVGVYFYSYASSNKEAVEDARWVLKQIKDYKVDLEVAFDWEDWSNFNSYKLSFHDLNEISESFMKEIKKAGYSTMLYGSKNYLERIWDKKDNSIWLAHYTSKTNYQGKYKYWQLCENGKVNGIDNFVDIDILYK